MLSKVHEQAIADGLKNCPFCGAKPMPKIRGAGAYAKNPSARCDTAGCMGAKFPVFCLDVPGDVAAWNMRASNDI